MSVYDPRWFNLIIRTFLKPPLSININIIYLLNVQFICKLIKMFWRLCNSEGEKRELYDYACTKIRAKNNFVAKYLNVITLENAH